MEEIKKRSPWVVVVIGLVALGMIVTYSSFFTGTTNPPSTTDNPSGDQNNAPATEVNETEKAPEIQTISYSGKDGVDALTLLKESHSVDATSDGFVNAIDGVKPVEKQYWALYINGELSMTGAKETTTKADDSIEWKLISF